MPIHTLHRKLVIPIKRAEAWAFFSDPRNLSKITPPGMGFRTMTPDLPAHIYAGLMIEYRVKPLAGIPLTWLTEITHVHEGESFVDEQRVGPYKMWHHEHFFRAVASDATEVIDLSITCRRLGQLVRC